MWCVYEMTYFENGSDSGSKVSEHIDREDAIKEMFKLNGWTYKQ